MTNMRDEDMEGPRQQTDSRHRHSSGQELSAQEPALKHMQFM
jgi:hypothetical protein